MSALREQQRAFVEYHVATGGRNAGVAYMAAYPECTKEACRAAASRLMRDPRVLAAFREEADKRVQGHTILATDLLMTIAENPQHKDQFRAIVEILNRAGMIVATRHEVEVTDNRSTEEIISLVKRLAEKANLPVEQLLGNSSGAIDAEFEELSNEGLEDLL